MRIHIPKTTEEEAESRDEKKKTDASIRFSWQPQLLVPVTVYGYITETVQKNEKKLYSVVLYQDEENEWAMLEAGAEQAKTMPEL